MTTRADILPPSEWAAFNRVQASAFIGVSPAHFDKLVREGVMPRPLDLSGRKVWSRHALKRALDGEADLSVNPLDARLGT